MIRTKTPVPSSTVISLLPARRSPVWKKQPVMIGLKASACAVLHLSTATAHSPCLPSETCTSFQANDTIWYAVGVIHVDNVSMWSSLQKRDYFLLWFFLFFFSFYSLSLTITRILGEFIASGLKLIISARHPKYKRNYVMVFCPGPNRCNDLQRKIWGGDFIARLVHLCGFRGWEC